MARLVEKVRVGNCGPLLVGNFGPPLKLGASAKKSNRGPKPIKSTIVTSSEAAEVLMDKAEKNENGC